MYDKLILVDEHDREIGMSDKVTVHVEGLLHRAFSVFIFNTSGQLLLQQRAHEKYHSPALWSNTVCSHPRPGETTLDACHRRLMEEMGLRSSLDFAFSFIYKVKFENGLTEHEFDHVYTGITDQQPQPEPSEVAGFRYISMSDLHAEIAASPDDFTAWLKICLPRLDKHLNR